MFNSKKKIIIASGSRHTIPPLKLSPGAARIIYTLTESKINKDFEIQCISQFNELLNKLEFDRSKYLHPNNNSFLNIFFSFIIKLTPYRIRKKIFGFT